MKRMILRGIENVSHHDVRDLIPIIEEIKIERIWSILNEELLFSPILFDPETGEKLENPIPRTLENPQLVHLKSAFLEDRVHDWNIYDGRFSYFSRIAGKGEKMDLLIEYVELEKP